MSGGVDRTVVRRAGGGGLDQVTPSFVRAKKGAVAEAELGQGCLVGAGKAGFLALNRGMRIL